MAARIGTWDDIFGDAPSEVQTVAVALRAQLKAAHPSCFEEARIGDRAYHFGIGSRKKTDGYAYLMGQKNRVNLGFYQVAELPDPDQLFEGSGKSLRHVKVRDLKTANSPAISALIAAAIAQKSAAR